MRITPEILMRAYAVGLFPMAENREEPTLHWIDPLKRGILPFDRFHIPRSLARTLRRRAFEIRVDTSFEAVVRACAEPTAQRPQTWINDEIVELYATLHAMGRAHSVEAWRDGVLVGGLYGVALGAAFFGESMFSRATDASKVALAQLVWRLKHSGFQLLDTQFVTPHLQRFGAIEIARAEYHRRLAAALSQQATFQGELSSEDESTLLRQSTTQTS